ncbi:hypothetical protein [Segatella albensis]|uniref:hypothetical protein n=1 Tax=Segatella albensis TaxID=77768 RepID=UPI0012B54423|nr:hypothetical protein [Segatella albensis]
MEEKSTDMSFKTMMVFATEMINLLKVRFSSSSIEDWQGYLVQRLSLMLQIFRTFSKVLLEDKDYITSNTILRMIVDNLAITKFIYVDHDGEMRLLRHYLFLLDGSLTYLKITDSMKSNVLIIEERERCKREVQHTKEQIMKLSIYEIQHLYVDKLLSKGNWKFKDFSNTGKYSYQDLYKTFGITPNIVAYFMYISQFAHGLSLSSLGTVASIQNVPFLLEVRDMLLGLQINCIYRLFSKYICNGELLESLSTKLSRNELDRFFELATNSNK